MRRNSVRLLKLFIGALVLVILGPTVLRHTIGGSESQSIEPRLRAVNHVPMGLPVDPDAVHVEEAKPQVEKPQELGQMIDWHDYVKIDADTKRTGPGEHGAAVILSPEEEKEKDALYSVNGFNAYASDKISLERSLKDIRHRDCRTKKYLEKLPTVSVVVPFHQEHWTTLLRTATSVINRAPSHLIHEVILVDDFSTKEHSKKQLDDYLATHFDGKVKVVRATKREGLIRARIIGAKAATGDVLIFLDSHVEATTNWLPPLLDPIARDPKTVVCPFIDVIDYENFEYRAQDEGARGAFDWEFFYKRLPRLKEDANHPADPFESPVMAGGLFAIDREWFWTLGGYDPGLEIWGGEQYELSFKIWQCGGKMVDAPCSRIGHIYRKFAPFPNNAPGDFVGRNYRRVAEVWMDEYATYLYNRRPQYKSIDTGDISDQLAIRKKLNCKPFSWFMKEVAFDLSKYYPPVEPEDLASGHLRNIGTGLCIDTQTMAQNTRFGLATCEMSSTNQVIRLSWHKDLRLKQRSMCFDVSQSIVKSPIILYNCHGMMGNQRWKYNLLTKQLFHPVSGQCLDCEAVSRNLFMVQCVTDSATQKWEFGKMNVTAIKEDWLLKMP